MTLLTSNQLSVYQYVLLDLQFLAQNFFSTLQIGSHIALEGIHTTDKGTDTDRLTVKITDHSTPPSA